MRLWPIAAALLALAGCAPPCELREVDGCRFEPAHRQLYYVPIKVGRATTLHPRWRSIPDRWFLTYAEGTSRQVDQATCEREGAAARHRPRWEFRDGKQYSYLDSPVAECTAEARP